MDDARETELAALDEILQMLFWLRGEGLAADANASYLARLTGLREPRIERLMQRLIVQGFVRSTAEGRYALTDAGVEEGGRRFADEFAELTKAGHGECNDPDCECRVTGDIDDCRHRVT